MKVAVTLLALTLGLPAAGIHAAENSALPDNPAATSARTEKTTDWLDTATPLQWLKDKEFDRLDKHLDALYEEVKTRPENEYRLIWAFFALENSYKETDKAVSEWRTASPRSHAARIVEAAQTISRAWDIRGTGYANKVSPENFARFHEGLKQAAEMLVPAIEARPDHPVAWYHLVSSQCPSGRGSCIPALAALLDKNAPHAYYPRRRLMNYMQPKWSGSMEIIEAYQHKLDEEIQTNPHWKPLLGFDQYVRCDQYRSDKNYQRAYTACKKAWSAGMDYMYLDEMSRVYPQVDRFQELREHAAQYKTRFPSDYTDDLIRKTANRMTWRGEDLVKEEKYALAMTAFDEALKVFPKAARAFTERGKLHFKQKNTDAAEADLHEAIAADPDYLYAYEWLMYILTERKAGAEMIPLWQDYLKRHPDEPKAHYELARAYYVKRDLESVRSNVTKACELGHDKACAWAERLPPQRTQ